MVRREIERGARLKLPSCGAPREVRIHPERRFPHPSPSPRSTRDAHAYRDNDATQPTSTSRVGSRIEMKFGRVARWSAWGIVGVAGIVLPLVTFLSSTVSRQEQSVAERLAAIRSLEWIERYASRLSGLLPGSGGPHQDYGARFQGLSRFPWQDPTSRERLAAIDSTIQSLEIAALKPEPTGEVRGEQARLHARLVAETDSLEDALWREAAAATRTVAQRLEWMNFLAPLSCALAVTLALLLFAYERSVVDRRAAEEAERLLREELAHVGRLSVVGEMGTKIAHELNQPLGAIHSYVAGCVRRLQRNENVPPEVIDALQKAMRETERASAIIRGLREFGRHSEGRFATVEINELVREILPILSAELRESRSEPELDLAEGLEPVQADKIQIGQVLVNLVRNSIEAMSGVPVSERRLIIRTQGAPDQMIEVQVEDTGCGISADLYPNLFQPFHSTKPKGMGIGLAISRTIVEAHEGTIRAEPRRGRGALFRFQLPCPSMVVTA